MTDRPVADREPLSEPFGPGFCPYCGERLSLFDAARAHPDEAGLDLSNKTLLARCLGNFTADAWRSLPSEVRGGWLENATDVQRAIACYSSRAARARPAVPVAGAEDWYDRDAKAFARAHAQTAALRAAQPEDDGLDVERLAEALHASDPKRYEDCYHGLTVSDCGIDAEDIAAEYARLSESSEGVERRDGA